MRSIQSALEGLKNELSHPKKHQITAFAQRMVTRKGLCYSQMGGVRFDNEKEIDSI